MARFLADKLLDRVVPRERVAVSPALARLVNREARPSSVAHPTAMTDNAGHAAAIASSVAIRELPKLPV